MFTRNFCCGTDSVHLREPDLAETMTRPFVISPSLVCLRPLVTLWRTLVAIFALNIVIKKMLSLVSRRSYVIDNNVILSERLQYGHLIKIIKIVVHVKHVLETFIPLYSNFYKPLLNIFCTSLNNKTLKQGE